MLCAELLAFACSAILFLRKSTRSFSTETTPVISQQVAGDVRSIARRPMKSDGPGDTGERSKLVLYELDKVSEFEAVVVDPSWGSRTQHRINRSAPIQSP